MKKLLLVDNDPTTRKVTLSELSGSYDVLEVASAADALDVFRSQRGINLLICGTELRPISGMELALLLMVSHVKLRAILMTDLPHDQWTRQQEKELAELPADHVTVLERPFTLSELKSAIMTLLPDEAEAERRCAFAAKN